MVNDMNAKTNSNAFVFVLSFLLCTPTLIWAIYKINDFRKQNFSYFESAEAKIRSIKLPAYAAIQYLNELDLKNEKALVFRQSDFGLYSKAKFAVDLDPKYVDIFSSSDVSRLHDLLLENDIRYIVLPDYPLPSIYNSKIAQLVGDINRTRLIFDNGHRIFFLNDSVALSDASLEKDVVLKDDSIGQQLFSLIDANSGQVLDISESLKERELSPQPKLFRRRDLGLLLLTGPGEWQVFPHFNLPHMEFSKKRQLALSVDYEGSGEHSVYVYQYNREGVYIGRKYLWGEVSTEGKRTYLARFLPDKGASFYRIGFSISPGAKFKLLSHTVSSFSSDTLQHLNLKPGWRFVVNENYVNDSDLKYLDVGLSGESNLWINQQSSADIGIANPCLRISDQVDAFEILVNGQGAFRVKMGVGRTSTFEKKKPGEENILNEGDLFEREYFIFNKSAAIRFNDDELRMLNSWADGTLYTQFLDKGEKNSACVALVVQAIQSKKQSGLPSEYSKITVSDIRLNGDSVLL